MNQVRVTPRALQDLREAMAELGLPDDSPGRLAHRLRGLETFPLLGPELPSGGGLRYLVGPWPWMIVVYRPDLDTGIVWVLSIVDARSSTSPLS